MLLQFFGAGGARSPVVTLDLVHLPATHELGPLALLHRILVPQPVGVFHLRYDLPVEALPALLVGHVVVLLDSPQVLQHLQPLPLFLQVGRLLALVSDQPLCSQTLPLPNYARHVADREVLNRQLQFCLQLFSADPPASRKHDVSEDIQQVVAVCLDDQGPLIPSLPLVGLASLQRLRKLLLLLVLGNHCSCWLG